MPDAPSISEIINIGVDPERGTGQPAVVFDNSDMLRNLNAAAMQSAENNWRKYTTFLGNLKEVYRDAGEISKMPVLGEDQQKIRDEMGKILSDISKDPKSFFSGGTAFQGIMGRLNKLSSDATQSKSDALYDEAHRKFFYANPALDTPENRALLDNFRQQPLGARKPYILEAPSVFDAQAFAATLAPTVVKDDVTEVLSPDNQFFEKTTTKTYDPKIWDERLGVLFNAQDPKGKMIRATVEKSFNSLPAEMQKMIGTPEAYFKQLVTAYKPQDSRTVDKAANPNYLKKETLAQEWKTAMANIQSQRERDYNANLRAGLMLKDGKWVPRVETDNTGRPIDYWNENIVPQIKDAQKKLPKLIGASTFSGDISINATDISGLSTGLFGEKTSEGKGMGIGAYYVAKSDGSLGEKVNADVKLRFVNGQPVGYSVNGVYIDAKTYNTKANMVRNLNVSNKFDVEPSGEYDDEDIPKNLLNQ